VGLVKWVREINEVMRIVSGVTGVRDTGMATFDCGDYSVRLFVKGLDDDFIKKLFGDNVCRIISSLSLVWREGGRSVVGNYDIYLGYGVGNTVVRIDISSVVDVDLVVQRDDVSVTYYALYARSGGRLFIGYRKRFEEDVSKEEFVRTIVDSFPIRYGDFIFVNHDEILSYVYDVVGGLHDFLVGDFLKRFVILSLFP